MSEDPTFTRKVNGNESVRIGDELRELLGVRRGDYVTFTVSAVHPREDQHE